MARAYIFVALVLALSISTVAQTKPTAATRAVDRYAISIEKLTASRKEPDLVMADAAEMEAEKPDWKMFDSVAALEKARDEKETYTIALNWKKNGKIVASNFTYFSPSGDWSQYVYHYFREDGTLARVDSELRTFMDDCVIKQQLYFSPAGRRLRKTLNYFDLNTDKPKKRCLGADALKFEYSLTVAKLPFQIR